MIARGFEGQCAGRVWTRRDKAPTGDASTEARFIARHWRGDARPDHGLNHGPDDGRKRRTIMTTAGNAPITSRSIRG